MSSSPGELAASFGVTVQGNAGLIVRSIALLDQTGVDQLAFLPDPLYLNQAVSFSAGTIIVSPRDLETPESQGHAAGRNWLIAVNSYAALVRTAQCSAALAAHPVVPGIRSSASVEEGAKVPASCSIGLNVTIEAGAVLGERVRIADNNFVGAGTRIDDNTLPHANVSIYHGCEVGVRCILHSGVVIGAGGFGFTPDFGPQSGEWVKIPQVGRVVISDDVEIGANTVIGRGAMIDTVVEQGCKIGNQMQIAHNVYVGAYIVIVGCAVISGSTRIGRYCTIGGAANFAGHLIIADCVTVSGDTPITKSTTKPGGRFISVFPPIPYGDWECNMVIVWGLMRMCERL